MSDTLTTPVARDAAPHMGARELGHALVDSDRPVGAAGPWKPFLLMIGALGGVSLFWRIWQQLYAWDWGLDSTTPEFKTYWMKFFYLNTGAIILVGGALFLWAIKECKVCTAQREQYGRILPRHEEHHIWILWCLLGLYCFSLFLTLAVFGEQDASWHQVAVRDTAFTPSHIPLFYGIFPVFVVLAVVSFGYAMKHIPVVYNRKRGFPLAWGLMLAGATTLMGWVGVNEWLHSFVAIEERFGDPLHWGFITQGLLNAAIFAVWFQTLPRVMQLSQEEKELKAVLEAKQPAAAGAPQPA
jgi:methane/ammonia monooxygenase subunit C